MGESKERPWGKINRRQPYDVVTRDLMRAFFHARMNLAERAIFQYVLERTWGDATRGKRKGEAWPEALPCEINLYSLATAWKLSRTNLKRARNDLVIDKILLRSDELYSINKDVDTWPASRIAPNSVEYAAQAIRAGRLPQSELDPMGVEPTPVQTNGGPPDPYVGVHPTPNRGPFDPHIGVEPTPSERLLRVEPTPIGSSHIGSARAVLNSIQFNSEESSLERSAPEDPQLALILGWARSAVEKAYPGDEFLLETVLPKVRSWMALEGYHPADISDAIHITIGRKKPSLVLLNYSKTILDDLRRKREAGRPAPQASSFKAEPVANKTKLKTYLEPIERPSPPNVDPKGKTR